MQPAAGSTRKTSGVPEHRLSGEIRGADAVWAEDLQDEAWEHSDRASGGAAEEGITTSFILIKNLLFWGSMVLVLAATGAAVSILF